MPCTWHASKCKGFIQVFYLDTSKLISKDISIIDLFFLLLDENWKLVDVFPAFPC